MLHTITRTAIVRKLMVVLGAITLFLGASMSHAAIIVPNADGTEVLNVQSDMTIDLARAVDGTAADAATTNGIYDAGEWAVIFKYSNVTIAEGATLRFKNHPSRAPVVWLVSGDVTIDGTLSLSGRGIGNSFEPAEPGPGGFRGGVGHYTTGSAGGPGFGPNGGARYNGGQYGYANPSIIPLIGGSGGGGDEASTSKGGGGAGGGAILIASQGDVTVNGLIAANAGGGWNIYRNLETGGGSGGGIRIICSTLSGAGLLQVLGGDGYQGGSPGRIRLERESQPTELHRSHYDETSLVPLADGDIAVIFPP